MNNLPDIFGYTWRPFTKSDTDPLLAFELTCGMLDGATKLRTPSEWQKIGQAETVASQTRIAINEEGKVAAAGWFEVSDRVEAVHSFLYARVHPNFRQQGIGIQLLLWLEEQAKQKMAQVANGRSQLLRLIFYDRAPDTITLYEKLGYERQYAEDEYLFDLKRPLPIMKPTPDLEWENYATENADDFYTAYRLAFSTRTDNLMSAEAWAHHFANPQDTEFQHKLSVLLHRKNELFGYAIVHAETSNEAWITQIGVSATQRRQGHGASIMVQVLQNMARASFKHAYLQVNQDNPQARALYEALGFTKAKTLYAYTKPLPA